ncbi:hypothetical protein A3A71_03580 [Candidatus Berkelbacteria bacterium RIFCSPLOWO2_01_FULL_50_28]|uniref:Glycosyl hydrolase 36 catalytic domain-containing protein n=1 Tax=Candidatus Berkelbacteria bacterium RIFCSPLOWO2_01_FULL_50_28 TaxID=1797471 RepID=A0A1F5ECP1_9BACT|nr:MAG: hypothetical protein A2807_03145 [Candidatus Berkelbacteria bacterium RIFCSPHIGHO2_01_FULL_50_36]OGD63506.1 MAG: hypothetical protein A3F39_00230 [Candidatus Berkelbacteria bacterium RIFCSPHIGHO2_12_FULL_50_11]OGD65135.1 MAG: hypothetical protein A3A71_03580 [Candidatus Berkelbacteria bacterium RIFCSPLOWO2_01_FULL_50_28]
MTQPDTKWPWENLLSNENYAVTLSQTGQGHFLRYCGRTQRVSTKRLIYLRDIDSGQVWNVGWYPSGQKLDSFRCVFRPEALTVSSVANHIESVADVFVPTDFDGEVWQVSLANPSAQKRRLSLFFVAEWPSEIDDATSQNELLVGSNRKRPDETFFLGIDRPIDSFDCNRAAFYGAYNNGSCPVAITEGSCSRSVARGDSAVAVIQKNITLGASAKTRLTFFCGTTLDLNRVRVQKRQLTASGGVEKHRAAKELFVQSRIEKFAVMTPESTVNVALNTWLQHQASSAFAANDQERAEELTVQLAFGADIKQSLIDLFAEQNKDGYFGSSETQLDTLNLLIAYLKETGDMASLSENVSYRDGGSGSLLGHFIRGLDFTISSPYDGLIVKKIGDQSVLLVTPTAKFAYILREALPIIDRAGEHHLVSKYSEELKRIGESVRSRAWSNGRLAYGLFDGNVKLGGARTSRQTDAATQAWAIISGILTESKAKQSLQTAHKNLSTPFGVLNFSPPYQKPSPLEPEISQESPGTIQNGSITAETAWQMIWAATILGNGDRAFEYFQNINPLAKDKRLVPSSEPFVFPRSVFPPTHPRSGQTINGWGDLSCAKIFTTFIETVIGVQASLGGLRLKPCLPRSWREVEINRRFRGADYHIRILNPLRASSNIDRITVDGIRIAGNVIAPFLGGTHYVEVVLA